MSRRPLLDPEAEEERRMTEKTLRRICLDHKGYSTPELNEVLYFHYKGFRRIEGLARYTGCRSLWLEGNGFTQIQGLEGLTNLVCLFLQENLIERIQNLHVVPQLRQLNLASNQIKEIGPGLAGLDELETLNLSNNRIETLEDLLGLVGGDLEGPEAAPWSGFGDPAGEGRNVAEEGRGVPEGESGAPEGVVNGAPGAPGVSEAPDAPEALEAPEAAEAAEAPETPGDGEPEPTTQPDAQSPDAPASEPAPAFVTEVHLQEPGPEAEGEPACAAEPENPADGEPLAPPAPATPPAPQTPPPRPCGKLSVLDLSRNRIETPDITKVLSRLPSLKVLYLTGNPIVRTMPRYRKEIIHSCPNLTYLDDRPVFPDERRAVEAFFRGGPDEELRERRRCLAEKRAEEKAQFASSHAFLHGAGREECLRILREERRKFMERFEATGEIDPVEKVNRLSELSGCAKSMPIWTFEEVEAVPREWLEERVSVPIEVVGEEVLLPEPPSPEESEEGTGSEGEGGEPLPEGLPELEPVENDAADAADTAGTEGAAGAGASANADAGAGTSADANAGTAAPPPASPPAPQAAQADFFDDPD